MRQQNAARTLQNNMVGKTMKVRFRLIFVCKITLAPISMHRFVQYSQPTTFYVCHFFYSERG